MHFHTHRKRERERERERESDKVDTSRVTPKPQGRRKQRGKNINRARVTAGASVGVVVVLVLGSIFCVLFNINHTTATASAESTEREWKRGGWICVWKIPFLLMGLISMSADTCDGKAWLITVTYWLQVSFFDFSLSLPLPVTDLIYALDFIRYRMDTNGWYTSIYHFFIRQSMQLPFSWNVSLFLSLPSLSLL